MQPVYSDSKGYYVVYNQETGSKSPEELRNYIAASGARATRPRFQKEALQSHLPCVPGADDKEEVVVRFLQTTRQTRHRQRRGDWLLERRSLAKDERSGVSRPNPRRQAFN